MSQISSRLQAALVFIGGIAVGVIITQFAKSKQNHAPIRKKTHWKKKSERKKERRAQRSAAKLTPQPAEKIDWGKVARHQKELRTIQGQKSQVVEFDAAGADFRLLRKAEAVLQKRSGRIILVLERCSAIHNYTAVIRTAECLGVQTIYVIDPPQERGSIHQKDRWEEDDIEQKKHVAYAREAVQWVDVRAFHSTTDCLKALKQDNFTIWATDLSQDAISLTAAQIVLPPKLAVVMGTESTGCSEEMLSAADERVYLPLHGFADSLNLSVAAAMVLQRLFFVCPEAVGDIGEKEKAIIRKKWYSKLARTPEEKQRYLAMCDNPPPPLGDLRRPDSHRAGWASKKVKRNAAARSSTGRDIQAAATLSTSQQ